jgi:hypothetical protein
MYVPWYISCMSHMAAQMPWSVIVMRIIMMMLRAAAKANKHVIFRVSFLQVPCQNSFLTLFLLVPRPAHPNRHTYQTMFRAKADPFSAPYCSIPTKLNLLLQRSSLPPIPHSSSLNGFSMHTLSPRLPIYTPAILRLPKLHIWPLRT